MARRLLNKAVTKNENPWKICADADDVHRDSLYELSKQSTTENLFPMKIVLERICWYTLADAKYVTKLLHRKLP